MKNTLSILSFIFLLNSCCISQKKEIVFDPIVLKAKKTSLYSENVNWEKVNSKFIELTRGKGSVEEMKEGLQYLINSLGDKHAVIRSTKDYSILLAYSGEANENDDRDGEFIDSVVNDISAKFSYKLLENGIGYLKVVAIGQCDVKEMSDFIRQGLIDLKEKDVDKWIVDLRVNGGGNMEPMISGLAPLIGEGNIGGAINGKNKISRTYKIENGQFNNYGRIVCEMNDSPKIPLTEKVAILLSRYTTSSGEMLAISFRGRENTQFIGEKTAGYTTGNGFDPFNDEMALVISQDMFVDRNGNTYKDGVGVDEEIEFQHYAEGKDNQMEFAIQWLNE